MKTLNVAITVPACPSTTAVSWIHSGGTSSMITPSAWGSTRIALTAESRSTKKFSVIPSFSASPYTGTMMAPATLPAAILSVPLLCT